MYQQTHWFWCKSKCKLFGWNIVSVVCCRFVATSITTMKWLNKIRCARQRAVKHHNLSVDLNLHTNKKEKAIKPALALNKFQSLADRNSIAFAIFNLVAFFFFCKIRKFMIISVRFYLLQINCCVLNIEMIKNLNFK